MHHQMFTSEYFEIICYYTKAGPSSKYAKKFVKSNKSTLPKRMGFLEIFFIKIKLLDQKIEKIFFIHFLA